MALTDKQLIVVEEQFRSRFPAYGWIFTFYPRRVIQQIGVESGRQRQDLSVEIKSKTGLIDRRILLEQASVFAWQELWLRFGTFSYRSINLNEQEKVARLIKRVYQAELDS